MRRRLFEHLSGNAGGDRDDQQGNRDEPEGFGSLFSETNGTSEDRAAMPRRRILIEEFDGVAAASEVQARALAGGLAGVPDKDAIDENPLDASW